ncbi:MAG: 3'-5' exonuclease [bacterium]|nr:3'-5' exonuclease [bacterium]
MDILKELNPQQKEAVLHTDGPLLVLAGAGSGKTRVITYRIAYLLHQGILPENILGVTFTNKAADEMKKRVETINNSFSRQRLWISTFHSACVRILRAHLKNPNFTIYDADDQNSLIKECLKELNVSLQPKAVLTTISRAKENLITAGEYTPTNFFEQRIKPLYELYQSKLDENNGLDFDDILMKTILLWQEYPQILELYQNRFKYLLVDEYQDTNYVQYLFTRMLAQRHSNICCVGDDDQSIYSFRGADIRNILDFEKDYKNVKIIRLEENYRSTDVILSMANRVISHNIGRKGKTLWTRKTGGLPVITYVGADEHQEASFVARKVLEISGKGGGGTTLNNFAVLYRVNAQSRVLEEAFRRANLPYSIIGGVSFYGRKEIKDILAYLKVMANPQDAVSLKRIINVPTRGIGKTTIQKIENSAREKGISLYSALQEIQTTEILPPKATAAIKKFVELMDNFINLKTTKGVLELTNEVLDKTGYRQELKELAENDRLDNIKEFLISIEEFETSNEDKSLEAFLVNISLYTNIDNWDDTSHKVNLMTLHSAKGLEFSYVFLAGLEEGILPHINARDEVEKEEERRLCYVGMTRAKEQLFLSYAIKRRLYSGSFGQPSRFLLECKGRI